jgi:3-oxoacyl-[acyl-carrier-protein] synthase-3
MRDKFYSVIIGSGDYIPPKRVTNEDFLKHHFYESDGNLLEKPTEEIIEKFREITTIKERRYVADDLVTSDIAFLAAQDALEDAGIDKESLDYLIVAHNFGDVRSDNRQLDIVPSLASRVKHKLGIVNPYMVAYDLPFGCPGWLQGVIQADYFLRSGEAKRALVIGAEVLSRVSDPHDRDSMLYADGAGAVVLEAKEGSQEAGILGHITRSDTLDYSHMLHMDKSYKEDGEGGDNFFLKMNGRKLYQYALEYVPQTVKDCLDKCKKDIREVSKVLIHQANGKMDDAILQRLFRLYGIREIPEKLMPMTVHYLGNTSVATLPTLFNLIMKGRMEGQKIASGETLVFASVGAGMNINALVYRML